VGYRAKRDRFPAQRSTRSNQRHHKESNKKIAKPETERMTLIELLMAMFFFLQITVAYGVAKGSHAGLLGYTFAILVGVTIAVAWIVAVYKVFGHFGEPLKEKPDDKRLNRLLGLAACGCLLWEIAGVALSGWITHAALHRPA
jgi:hypothetical protein